MSGFFLHALLLTGFYIFTYKTALPTQQHFTAFVILLVSYVLSSFISGKAFITKEHSPYEILRKINLSFFITLGLFVLLLLAMIIEAAPRVVILSTLVAGTTIEGLYFLIFYGFQSSYEEEEDHPSQNQVQHPFKYIVAEFSILLFVTIIYRIFVIGSKVDQNSETVLYATILIGWLYAGSTTHRFNIIESSGSLLQASLLLLKAFVIQFALAALAIYYIDIQNPLDWLGVVPFYAVISTMVFFLFFSKKMNGKAEQAVDRFLRDFETNGEDVHGVKHKYKVNEDQYFPEYSTELEYDFLKDYPEVFQLINRTLDLSSFSELTSRIRRTSDVYNFEIFKNSSMQLIINLQKMNDIRRINYYLRTINQKLTPGGVFVSCVFPNVSRFHRTIENYPGGLGHLFYFLDFLWRRVCIKLPVVRQFYFWVTKGKDRAISLAETLGRLVFNGFEIMDIKTIDSYFYFVAKKIQEPSSDTTAKHRFFFRMRRVGLNGKEIIVYKVRTMHPYSEYIQQFLYERSKLEVGGKFRNDFRITSWGAVFRKLWIDELPMLLNMAKGELKIVGVRPLSNHYLTLYSEEYRKYRSGFKPGLIPPYYADMPETIEEIEESERRYLNAYEKAPLRTDILYFFKAAKNILLRGKRSA